MKARGQRTDALFQGREGMCRNVLKMWEMQNSKAIYQMCISAEHYLELRVHKRSQQSSDREQEA